MRRVLSAIAAAALTALAAAPAMAADKSVTVGDNFFSPPGVAVMPGESVTWNAGETGNQHNVRIEDGGLNPLLPPARGPWTTSRTFPTAGAYRYYCEIHGGPGGSGMSGIVHVNAAGNLPPFATLAVSPNPVRTGQPVTFTASASDTDGTIAKYEWDLDGNGEFETDTLTAATASRSYTSPATLTVKLRVTDDDGATAEAARSLRVDPPPTPPAPPAAGTAPPLAAPAVAGPPAALPLSFAASKRTVTVSRSGRFRYAFAAASGLAGTVTFESVAKVRVSARRRISLGTKRLTVPASGIATVQMKLSRKNLRILKRNRRIRFRVAVTLRNPAGGSRSGTSTLTLKRPRSR